MDTALGRTLNKCLLLNILGICMCFSSGCMAPMVLLKNDKNEIVKCEAGAGNALLSGYIGTKMQTNACVKQYEAAGYKRVDGK